MVKIKVSFGETKRTRPYESIRYDISCEIRLEADFKTKELEREATELKDRLRNLVRAWYYIDQKAESEEVAAKAKDLLDNL